MVVNEMYPCLETRHMISHLGFPLFYDKFQMDLDLTVRNEVHKMSGLGKFLDFHKKDSATDMDDLVQADLQNCSDYIHMDHHPIWKSCSLKATDDGEPFPDRRNAATTPCFRKRD